MTVFTEAELKLIRERAKKQPEIFEQIELETRDVREHTVIPDRAYSTWEHYFVCPKHGVKLIHNHYDSKHFVCPIDSEVYEGEPYEGGWWTANNYKNSRGCRALAASFIATGDTQALATVKKILLGYAKSFKNFEVHGDIPYNKPGRMNSQVLCDSAQIYDYIFAYALAKEQFTADERRLIENELFIPATEHIMANISHQIHNHEVAICCTVGSVGIVLGRRDFCEFAVNEKYGLKYQLDNALLPDGMWFEGSTGYHFYSIKWFLSFEKLARYTEYSLTADAHYRELLHRMLLFPMKLIRADGSLPSVNDGAIGENISKYSEHYELGYSIFGDERLASMLRLALSCSADRAKRFGNLDGLLFGVEELPQAELTTDESYIDMNGSGLAVLRGDEERYFIFKASPYGGEHDHYDRLSISFEAFGKPLSQDLGTTAGYGVPMHYAYYKNTATHNTVCIDGKNIAPCQVVPLYYGRIDGDGTYLLDAMTLPPEEYTMPDTFTIKAWDDEAYRGSAMRRRIIWRNKYFIDIFKLRAKNELRKEWIWHTAGEVTIPDGAVPIGNVAEDGPQSLLHSAYLYTGGDTLKLTHDCGDGIMLDIHAYLKGRELILAKGKNNPATSELGFTIERCYEEEPLYVNLIEAYRKGEATVGHIEVEENGDTVTVTVYEVSGEIFTHTVNL